MSKDVAIFINVRKNSRRCPNKMLRPFADSTLIDMLLEKVKTITRYPVYFCAHEQEFLKRAKAFDNLQIIERSRESADADSDPAKVFQALESIPTEFVAWINPSHPFLKIETFLSAIKYFEDSRFLSLSAAKKKKGWFYASDGWPLNNKENFEVDTMLSEWIYEIAHSFHIYRRQYMLTHGKPWANVKDDPALLEISPEEAWDIDTEEEFIMVEELYKRKILNKE